MNRVTRILIVEDEYLIAMDLAATLQEHGFEAMGPVASVEEALELLESEKPNAVILDLNLRGQAATAVAGKLRELDVPFVIASAYSNLDLPRDNSLRGIVNVGKPTKSATLIKVLHRITGLQAPESI